MTDAPRTGEEWLSTAGRRVLVLRLWGTKGHEVGCGHLATIGRGLVAQRVDW